MRPLLNRFSPAANPSQPCGMHPYLNHRGERLLLFISSAFFRAPQLTRATPKIEHRLFSLCRVVIPFKLRSNDTLRSTIFIVFIHYYHRFCRGSLSLLQLLCWPKLRPYLSFEIVSLRAFAQHFPHLPPSIQRRPKYPYL